MMDFPDGEPHQFTFFDEGCGRWGIDFGPAGECYFGAKSDNAWNVFRIDCPGANPDQLTDNSLYDGDPAVSPAGDRICFITKRYYFSYYDRELALMNADGSSLTRFTIWEGSDDSPVWSPDGSKLAFVREFEYGQYSIMIADAGSGDSPYKLTSEEYYAYDPMWTPDGSAIICVMTVNGIRDLYRVPLEGGTYENLTQTDWSDECPAISPDGTEVAHQVYHSGQWDLAVTRIDDCVTRFITIDANEDLSPCWSPDGTWLFWIRIVDGDREVFGTPVESEFEFYRITESPGDDIRIICR